MKAAQDNAIPKDLFRLIAVLAGLFAIGVTAIAVYWNFRELAWIALGAVVIGGRFAYGSVKARTA